MTSQTAKLDSQPSWMDLKTVQRYACVSERTVREWIHLAQDPLPAVQVGGGKILINRDQFDEWLEAHPYRQAEGVDVGMMVEQVLNGLNGAM